MAKTTAEPVSRFVRRGRTALLALLLTLAAPGARSGEESPPPPREPIDQTVNLDLWGKDLSEALSQIIEQTNIDIFVSGNFLHPKQFPSVKVLLTAQKLPARTAVEWLCRAIGCRYRIEKPRLVTFSDQYDWMKEEPRAYMPTSSLDSLMRKGQTPAEFRGQLRELMRVNSLFGEFYNIDVEVEQVGPRETKTNLVAMLPDTLRGYLQKSLDAMAAPGEEIAPPAGEPPLDPDENAMLKKLQAKVFVNYKDYSVRQALADLARQSGVNIGFDHDPFRKRPLPTLNLDLGETTLGKALEELGKAMGLAGYELMPPEAVWLTETGKPMAQAVSREFLWDNLTVRAYRAAGLPGAEGDGRALIERVKRNACPRLWDDPATSMLYHDCSGNLIVIAPAAAQRLVLRELSSAKAEADAKGN